MIKILMSVICFFGDYILDKGQQTCKVCGRPDKFDFYVPNSIWEAIVPQKFQGHVVCLFCFDEFAKEQDINYSNSLQDLCFAGRKATFRFEVAYAGDD